MAALFAIEADFSLFRVDLDPADESAQFLPAALPVAGLQGDLEVLRYAHKPRLESCHGFSKFRSCDVRAWAARNCASSESNTPAST
jgi:hypothetical protein